MRIICCICKDFVRQLKAFLPSFCLLCLRNVPGVGAFDHLNGPVCGAFERHFGPKKRLCGRLSIAVLVYNQFETPFYTTQENPLHCLWRCCRHKCFPILLCSTIFLLRVLQGNTVLDLHKLILNRQGCYIIQQCLLTITLYLFTNKLSEYCVANFNIFDLL